MVRKSRTNETAATDSIAATSRNRTDETRAWQQMHPYERHHLLASRIRRDDPRRSSYNEDDDDDDDDEDDEADDDEEEEEVIVVDDDDGADVDRHRRNKLVESPPRLYEDDGDEQDWRSAAQMLDDERSLLLLLNDDGRAGNNPTDNKNSRRVASSKQMRAAGRSRPARDQQRSITPVSLRSTSSPGQQHQQSHQQLQDDDGSSISFAQSACHSILSAWRLRRAARAANKQRQQRASGDKDQVLPVAQSVLSQPASELGHRSVVSRTGSQYGGRGKSPAASTRIPLGPKAAQHYVTNSRRRRRANELILDTLEARRRVARQSALGGSIWGSESYLLGCDPTTSQLCATSGRLSLSPSPVHLSPLRLASSPSHATKRVALSDLGRPSAAAQAQRQRLLQQTASGAAEQKSAGSKQRPPLAKLDQNSSDLCSSNSSDPDSSDDAKSSSGSNFTELVTRELVPECIRLDSSIGLIEDVATGNKERSFAHRLSAPAPPKPAARPLPAAVPPKVPARRKSPTKPASNRTSTQEPTAKSTGKQQVSNSSKRNAPAVKPKVASSVETKQQANNDKDSESSRFRRGALKRDSIRRMRLNRAAAAAAEPTSGAGTTTSSSSPPESSMTNDSPPQVRSHSSATMHSQTSMATTASSVNPLPESRRQRIENNPFLNRGHFRRTEPPPQPPRPTSADSRTRAPTPPARTGVLAPQSHKNRHSLQEPAVHRRIQSEPRVNGKLNIGADNHVSPPKNEEVKQVERMLRRMQPNQSIGSKSFETSEQTSVHKYRSQDVLPDRVDNVELGKASTFVDEQVRSSSRKIDPRQQLYESDRSRHERTAPRLVTRASRIDGADRPAIVSEEKVFRDCVHVIRSTTNGMPDPPVGFADSSDEADKGYTARPELPRREHVVETKNRKRLSELQQQASVAKPAATRPPVKPPKPPTQQQQIETPVSKRTGDTTDAAPKRTDRESLIDALRLRPAQQQQPPPVSARSRPAQRPSATQSNEGARLLDSSRIIQSSLPKFERTADDEFKKRVDQLRQMARANLSSSSSALGASSHTRTTGNGLSRSNDSRRSLSTTRPMSTNWSSNGGAKNLMEALKADGYIIEPLGSQNKIPSHLSSRPVGAWRRSNSSLASIGSPARAAAPSSSINATNLQGLRRPLSPPASRTTPPPISGGLATQRHLSSPPSSTSGQAPVHRYQFNETPRSTSPMRLLVREKTAPKLDYAFVQPSSAESSPPQLARHLGATAPAAPVKRAASPPRPLASPSSPATNNDTSSQASRSNQQRQAPQESPSSVGILQSILRRNQKAAQKLAASLGDTSDGVSSSKTSSQQPELASPTRAVSPPRQETPARRPDSPPAVTRQQVPLTKPTSGQQSNKYPELSLQQQQPAAKRVHFNDRTSVRSFESISSHASNEENNIRQQIGSPDSMGSGSTSRLSGESPDAMGRPLGSSGSMDPSLLLGNGAAIYAVRGEDLDFDPHHQQQMMFAAQPAGAYTSQIVGGPMRSPAQQQQQLPPTTSDFSGHQQRQAIQQHQPSIRMTAPPSINTTSGGRMAFVGAPVAPYMPSQQQQPMMPVDLQGAPVAPPRQTHLAARQFVVPAPPPPPLSLPAAELDSDLDASYALQLRRAAAQTSRAFQYGAPYSASAVSPQQQMSPQQVQQMHQQQSYRQLPAPLSPAVIQQQQQQVSGGIPMSRRSGNGNLHNFQTEV